VMCVWVPQNASVVWAPALPMGTSQTQAAAVVDWDDTASSISASSNNSVWHGGVDHDRFILDDDDAASSISVSTSAASTISTTSSAVSPRRRRRRPNRKRSNYKGLGANEQLEPVVDTAGTATVVAPQLSPPADQWSPTMAVVMEEAPRWQQWGRQQLTDLPPTVDVDAFPGGVDVRDLQENSDLSCVVMTRLERGNTPERNAVIAWLHGSAKPLALSRCGCRVIQKLLEVVGGNDREALFFELFECFGDLYSSSHGNHVLQKMVEVMPPAKRALLLREFTGRGHKVARHRFGCRILERVIEHCSENDAQAASLLDDVVADAPALCRHQYGNFVVQHLVEHGSEERRSRLIDAMLSAIPAFSMHRTASHCIQRALLYGNDEGRDAIVDALLAEGANALVDIACSRSGSFVLEQLAAMPARSEEIRRRLMEALPRLQNCCFGQRVAVTFGLLSDLG